MTYEIKQKINNTSIPPTIYDKESTFDETNICYADGRFGIICKDDNEQRLLLPFEYDNITMAGFSLYLLIKDGKMGIAHIKRVPNSGGGIYFELLKLIPCEYDLITFPTNGESFVLMRKDTEESSHFQIYFIRTKKVSDSFWRVEYIDRDFIAVTDIAKSKTVILSRSGKQLFTYNSTCFCHAFESEEGTVFFISKDDRTCELLLFKKKPKPGCEKQIDDYYYRLSGEIISYQCKHNPKPIFAPKIIRTHERNSVLGFIVEKNGKHYHLNGNLEVVAEVNSNNFSLTSAIEESTSKTICSYITEMNTNYNED